MPVFFFIFLHKYLSVYAPFFVILQALYCN